MVQLLNFVLALALWLLSIGPVILLLEQIPLFLGWGFFHVFAPAPWGSMIQIWALCLTFPAVFFPALKTNVSWKQRLATIAQALLVTFLLCVLFIGLTVVLMSFQRLFYEMTLRQWRFFIAWALAFCAWGVGRYLLPPSKTRPAHRFKSALIWFFWLFTLPFMVASTEWYLP